MATYSIIAQIIVAFSIVYVGVFRFDNIVKEFKQYQFNDLTRILAGFTKLSMFTLLVAGIWYPALVLIPSLIIVFLMVGAPYVHFKANNTMAKRLNSLVLSYR